MWPFYIHCPYITDASILALSEHCPHLQELDVHNCTPITESAVLHLIQCCRQLHTLVLPSTCMSEGTVFGFPVQSEKHFSTATYILDSE